MAFKGIIEFGAQKDTSYFATQSTFNDAQSCFLDGAVINITANDTVNMSRPLLTTTKKYTLADLSTDYGNLSSRRALGWGRLRHNFARMQLANTDVAIDWFSGNLPTFINNVAMVGRLAAEAGLKGVWLDTESYGGIIWNYSNQAQKGRYTFEQYQQQVKSVAKEIVKQIRTYSRDVSFMTTFAYEYFAEQNPATLSTNEIGLYGAFLDGLHDEWGEQDARAGRSTEGKIILTTEASYELFDENNLSNLLSSVNGTKAAAYRGGSSYFGTVNEYGLANWLDKPTFDPGTPNSNFFTPDNFEDAIDYMMDNCDWCWVYTATNPFFGGTGPGVAYLNKLVSLRSTYGLY